MQLIERKKDRLLREIENSFQEAANKISSASKKCKDIFDEGSQLALFVEMLLEEENALHFVQVWNSMLIVCQWMTKKSIFMHGAIPPDFCDSFSFWGYKQLFIVFSDCKPDHSEVCCDLFFLAYLRSYFDLNGIHLDTEKLFLLIQVFP